MLDQLFGVGALAHRGSSPFIGGLCGDHSPHRTTMTQTKCCSNFAFWVMVAAHGKASMEQSWFGQEWSCRVTQQPHKNKAAVELSQSMRLGLMPSDTVVSQRNAFKELSRLVKLGLLPCDAVVSQRKASKEQSRLVQLGLLPYDATASQNKAAVEERSPAD